MVKNHGRISFKTLIKHLPFVGETTGGWFPLLWFVSFFVIAVVPYPALAGNPTEQLKKTTDKILAIVSDSRLKEESKAEERRRLIRKAVDERFDWEELSRRALGRHWARRTNEERRNFVALFGELLERTYLERVEGYSGERVSYLGEKVDGEYATVDAGILTARKTEIPILYRMKQNGGSWMVYDISIEGVSLVGNYRNQFQSILAKSSYDELVRMLKKKVEEK
ncbi:MAG: ABC transporter substrate-binding protein [Deltaproteobacteria bacterium]|nr:ABC transporter substrate-binding protein [Deltaproteobacteria bacterium]